MDTTIWRNMPERYLQIIRKGLRLLLQTNLSGSERALAERMYAEIGAEFCQRMLQDRHEKIHASFGDRD